MMDNVSKATLGLEARRLRKPAITGTLRNAALQAKSMNGAGVGLNVLPGLPGLPGLGAARPALAMRSPDAPATVLAVKNCMPGNSPLAALRSSYSHYLKTPV
ncbi:hypothetical protein [Desulfovibrio sp.]|uniref:hypothetical protein n=1 Tax=Desulfovibrio sp. TaxID=885 RepID=UPI003D0F7F82